MENENTASAKPGKNYFLPVSIIIAALLISGSVIYTNGKKANTQGGDSIVKVSVDDDPRLGSEKAKLTLVEFSDYQCPFCRKYWREVIMNEEFRKDYIDSGKVSLVLRDFPLSFHPMALPSSLAAECAKDQGKYWEYHDKIFEEQDKEGENTIAYDADDLKKWASDLGLNTGDFNSCLDTEKHMAEVQKDFNDGVSYGIDGTPVTFINGKPLVGAQPWTVVKAILDAELAKK